MLRFLLLMIVAASFAGCAAFAPSVMATAPDGPIITEPSTPERRPAATKPPAPKPATASTTSGKDKLNAPSPQFGSPEWEKEEAEKERRLKQVIQGICRGC
jgi:DMSO/TMAO reductase YedYZ molybdopterin-dependent catalytic subunit